METIEDKLARLARKCAVCGHEWIKSSAKRSDPARCPNHACRSSKWRCPTGRLAKLIAILKGEQ